MRVPRPFGAVCRLSELVARAREAADHEHAYLAALATVLALAIYYR